MIEALGRCRAHDGQCMSCFGGMVVEEIPRAIESRLQCDALAGRAEGTIEF